MKAFPTTDFSSSTPASNSSAYISRAQSKRTIAVDAHGQNWQGEITTAWERLPLARAIWAFLNARGEHEAFDLILPIHSTPQGVVSGAVKAIAAYAIGTNVITFVNYAPAAGDFFRCAGHAKVYQVEDSVANTATIYPPLINAVTLNEVITVTDVPFSVRRVGAVQKMEIKNKNMAQLSFKYEEAF